MIKILLFVFCGLLVSFQIAFGQQLPISHQNYLNTYTLQPAYTGHQEGLNTWGSFRKSISGYSGAPNTVALNLTYRNTDKHGFGGSFNTDQAGLFRNTAINLSYAYRLKIKASNYLSAGFSGGLAENRFDFASISVEDKTDLGTLSNNGKLMLNFGFGLAFTNKRLTLGVGLPILYSTNVKYRYENTNFNYQLRQQKIVNASYVFDITKSGKIQIIPTLILRNQPSNYWVNDYVATIQYDKRFSLTSGYRSTGVVPVVLALEIKKNCKVFYGQDIAISKLANFTKGGFEIGLAYKFPLRNGREHKLDDQRREAQLDSLTSRLSVLKDTLKQKNYRLIEYENVNEKNTALLQEIDKLKKQLAATENQQQKIVSESIETEKSTSNTNQENTKEDIQAKKEVISGKSKQVTNSTNSKSIDNQNVTINEDAGFYIVVESSKNRVALERDLKIWNEKEESIFIIKSKKSNWYFIATEKYDDLDSSMKALKETRKKYKKSWVKVQ